MSSFLNKEIGFLPMVRIAFCVNLKVDESMLTGESDAVEKHCNTIEEYGQSILDHGLHTLG
jgi:magnesium-transporting ATPase (P-type)